METEFLTGLLPLLILSSGLFVILLAESWASFIFFTLLILIVAGGEYLIARSLLMRSYYAEHIAEMGHVLGNKEYVTYVNKTSDPEERIARANLFWPIWDEHKKLKNIQSDLEAHTRELEADGLQSRAEYAELKQLIALTRTEVTRLSKALENLVADSQSEARIKQLEKLRLANEALEQARASMSADVLPELEQSMLMHDLITSESNEISDLIREIELETEQLRSLGEGS
jgi:hypothetical protein